MFDDFKKAISTITFKEGMVTFEGIEIESSFVENEWWFFVGNGVDDEFIPYCYLDENGDMFISIDETYRSIFEDFFEE